MRLTVSRSVAVASLLLALVLAGTARTRPRYGGTLRLACSGDPVQSTNSPAKKLMFDTLTEVDAAGQSQPGLAVSWESQNGDHRWQFKLRSGVQFHDGSPLTAGAVAKSLVDACGRCGWKVRGAGDSVIVTSDAPLPGLPGVLARSRYAISQVAADGSLLGTGPFKLNNVSSGIAFLVANDDYWQGRPFVDGVEVYGNRSLRQQWIEFSADKLDVVEIPPELLRDAQQDRIAMVVSRRPTDLVALTILDSQLKDGHLREALAVALDRTSLYTVIFQKQGEITASLLPSGLSGYEFLFTTAPDATRSRELRGGQTPQALRLAVDSSDHGLQLSAERLALNLHEAGWNVKVVPVVGNANAELNLRRVHLEAGDAASALREMMETFGGPSVEDTADASALYRAERGFLQMHTVVPLLYLPRAYGITGRVHNLALSADGTPLYVGASVEDGR
jgi:peptide/nickel transport system substrate-binding protein